MDAEKLKEIIRSTRVKASDAIPDNHFLMMLDDIGFFPQIGVGAICGRAKHGKTQLATIFASSLLGNQDFGFICNFPKDKKILYIDTEQTETDTILMCRRVNNMLGYDEEYNDERIMFHNILACEMCEYTNIVKGLVEEYKNELACIIVDGIADFVEDINASKDGMAVVKTFQQIAQTHECFVLCLIHLNENETNKKPTGHIGSALLKKIDDVFISVNNNETFTAIHELSRHKKIKNFSWKHNDGYLTPTDGTPPTGWKHIQKVLCENSPLSHSVLNKSIAEMVKKENEDINRVINRTKKWIDKCKDCGYIKKDQNGNYYIP